MGAWRFRSGVLIGGTMGKRKKPGPLAVPGFLRQWRDYRDLTQEELAVKAGMTAASISQIESGTQWFSDTSLAALAKALDCTPAALIGYNPLRPDSFWPLFEAVENLEAGERRQLRKIIASAIRPDTDEPR